MKLELEKAFDKELKKELNKSRRIWLFLAIGIILVLAIFTPIFSKSIYGETTELAVKDRSDVSKIRMKVKLNSGKVIVILVDNDLEHLTGRKVEILKMTSVAGMASYQFVQYVESDT